LLLVVVLVVDRQSTFLMLSFKLSSLNFLFEMEKNLNVLKVKIKNKIALVD
jgi:hypothetical protein